MVQTNWYGQNVTLLMYRCQTSHWISIDMILSDIVGRQFINRHNQNINMECPCEFSNLDIAINQNYLLSFIKLEYVMLLQVHN